MSGSEVAIYAASVPDRMRYAEALSGASLLPAAYRGKPANVLLALEYGAALGIAPMVAIQGIHVIEGKPSASAGLIGALVRKAGHRMRVSGDDTSARCEIVRGDDPDFTFTSEWTMERAAVAGLTGKAVWKNYPAAMLKARAITEAARDACPEALSGVNYTAEELGDDTAPSEAYPTTVEVVTEADSGAAGRPPMASSGESDSQPAAPESDIEDAVIVEDTPLFPIDDDPWATPETDAGAGEAVPPAGAPASSADAAADLDERYRGERAASEPQLRKMGAMFRERGITDRDARLGCVAEWIGHDVESAKDLTMSEAKTVIDALARMTVPS